MKPWKTRLMMNSFPALLFQGIRLRKISPDFKRMEVRVRRNLLKKNLQKAIFGGSIFSAGDPYMAIMYWQLFAHQGIQTEAWLKKAEIAYLKPATTHLDLVFELSEAEVNEALQAIEEKGKFERWHTIEAKDQNGQLCAGIRTLVHLRKCGFQNSVG